MILVAMVGRHLIWLLVSVGTRGVQAHKRTPSFARFFHPQDLENDPCIR